MQIKPLIGVGIEKIHHAFKEAFCDYAEPFNLTVTQLQHMIERRGYKEELSFGAYVNDDIVGFTLNGLGGWNHQLTAYDTGTGVVKAYRKQGVASQIFETSLPILREYGISQYLLEVIKINTKAVDLYVKAGFTITREFDYWTSPVELLKIRRESLVSGFSVVDIKTPDWEPYKSFWDFSPSWQNSIESITRKLDDFLCMGVLAGDHLVAYGFMERETGDVPQLAVHPEYRSKRLGTELICCLLDAVKPINLKVINTPTDSLSMKHYLIHLGLKPGHGQYEMIRKL